MFGHQLNLFDMAVQSWIELVLSLPIVLWAGWPFFSRGWQSVVNRSPNMWTLIGLGTGAAFIYQCGRDPLRRKSLQTDLSPWVVSLFTLKLQRSSFH